MSLLGSILVFTLVAVLAGKWAKKKGCGWYTMLVIITIAQVAVLLYQMINMESPTS